MSQSSTVLYEAEQQQVAKVLEHDAQVVSNTQLKKQLAGQPQKTQDEIIKIDAQAQAPHPQWRFSTPSSPAWPGCSSRSA